MIVVKMGQELLGEQLIVENHEKSVNKQTRTSNERSRKQNFKMATHGY